MTYKHPVALGLVMRNALLAGLVFLTAACGAYSFPGASPAATGTVTGTVLFSIIGCPRMETATKLCPAGGPEPDSAYSPACSQAGPAPRPCTRPLPGLEIEFVKGQATVKTTTNANGQYTVSLVSGTWQVHLNTPMRMIKGPSEVTVAAGSTVTANYVIDSGIRYAVPQS